MAQPYYYGGQAVMEGVMMRGRSTIAVAVRAPDGFIVVYEEELKPGPVLRKVKGWPFIRGAVVLWDTLLLGMRALIFSANVSLAEEDDGSEEGAQEEPALLTGPFLWITVGLSLLFSIALFFVLPLAAIGFLDRWIASDLVSNLVEGAIRLGILLGYMWFIGRMPDISRVFGYHGAEHKTINAWEAGLPMDVANVRTRALAHVRCGTGFLLLVVVISVFIFALLGRPPWVWRVASRIFLVPVIAAIGYEVIRFGAAHAEHVIMKVILWPGMLLQRVTTREPDDSMLEVAIAAFKRVAVRDQAMTPEAVEDGVIAVDQLGQPLGMPEPMVQPAAGDD